MNVSDYVFGVNSFDVETVQPKTSIAGMALTPEEMASRARRLRGRRPRDEFAKLLGYAAGSSWQRYEEPETYRRSPMLPRAAVTMLERWLASEPRVDLTPAEIAEFLGRTPPSAVRADDGAGVTPEPLRIRRRLLVYGQAAAGEDGRFLLNGQVVGDVPCPPQLEAVPDAYAVYVHGDSMVPRYFSGEVLWVHPHKPVRAGDFVVAQISDSPGEAPSGYVKQLVSRGRELVLRQFNPPEGESELMRFPGDQVVSLHKVIGSVEA